MPLTKLTTNRPKRLDPMQYYKGSQETAMPDIKYQRNMADPAYQEWIFADGQYIGEIYGGVLDGYELRKVKEIQLAAGAAAVDLETIAYFDTVCDAKCFVNQAGGL